MHGSSLTYAWLSDGTKVSARADDGSGNGVVKRYLGSFVYSTSEGSSAAEPTDVESVAWDEGRIFFAIPEAVPEENIEDPDPEIDPDEPEESVGWLPYRDCWFAGDHLGNVRTVIDITPDLSAPQILEQNDYLPFGTRIQNPDFISGMNNRWRYAGKEEQRFGLAGAFSPIGNAPFSDTGFLDLSLLDFGARMYDPFTARWISIDKMAQTRFITSPMIYCSDNPINRIDVDGNTDWGLVKKGIGATLSGAGTVGSGIVLTGSTYGAAVALGGLLVVDGFSAIGIGTAMITAGFLTPDEKVDPTLAEKTPSSLSNAMSKSADIIAGNENNEIETETSVISSIISLSTFTLNPQNIGDLISDLGTIVQIGNTSQQVNNLIKAGTTQQTTSSSETERSLYNEEWQEYLWTPNY